MHTSSVIKLLCLYHALVAHGNPVPAAPGSFTIPLHPDHELAARADGADLVQVDDPFEDIPLDRELELVADDQDINEEEDDDGPVYTGPKDDFSNSSTTNPLPPPPPPKKRLGKRQSGSKTQAAQLAIYGNKANGADAYYYTKVKVGKAKKDFYVVVDTGSTALVLPGRRCGKEEGCAGDVKYDMEGKDQHDKAILGYHDGRVKVEGDIFLDEVSIGSLSEPSMPLFSISRASDWLGTTQSMGILGLQTTPFLLNEPPSPPRFVNGRTLITRQQPSFFEKLLKSNSLSRPLFACYLGRTDSRTASRSEISFGAVNPSLGMGPVKTIPVLNQGRDGWLVPTEGMTVNHDLITRGVPASQQNIKAHIDTASPLIMGPHDALAALFARIPESFAMTSTVRDSWVFYALPCDASPDVAVVMGGFEFRINAKDFVGPRINSKGQYLDRKGNVAPGSQGRAGSTQFTDAPWRPDDPLANFETKSPPGKQFCVSRLMSSGLNSRPGGEFWILGAPFLRNWYSIFTWENGEASVGFVAAKGNNEDKGPVRVGYRPPLETE